MKKTFSQGFHLSQRLTFLLSFHINSSSLEPWIDLKRFWNKGFLPFALTNEEIKGALSSCAFLFSFPRRKPETCSFHQLQVDLTVTCYARDFYHQYLTETSHGDEFCKSDETFGMIIAWLQTFVQQLPKGQSLGTKNAIFPTCYYRLQVDLTVTCYARDF